MPLLFLMRLKTPLMLQMKMFLTRMGKNAKFMITGDPGQIDLPRRVISGLKEAFVSPWKRKRNWGGLFR